MVKEANKKEENYLRLGLMLNDPLKKKSRKKNYEISSFIVNDDDKD
jgi:hypothetical protein